MTSRLAVTTSGVMLPGRWAVASIAAIWLGIEIGPGLLAHVLAWWAGRRGRPANPLLFLDPEAERRERMVQHFEDTSGNPTLR